MMKKLIASMLGLILTAATGLAGVVHGLIDGSTGREITVLTFDAGKTQMVSTAVWYYSPSPGVTNAFITIGNTNYVFNGAGTTGLVSSSIADVGKFLRADGTWQAAGGGVSGLTNTIGSWIGTNINLQGGTSVTVRTVGSTNYLDSADANFAAQWIKDTGVNGKLTTGSLIYQTNLFVVDVMAGTGYINYGASNKKISWLAATTNTTTMSNGVWWAYVDPNSAVKFSQVQPDIFQNITLGFFFNSQFGSFMVNNLNNTLIDQMGTRLTQYLYSMGPFLTADAGNIVAKGTTNTSVQSSQCNVQSGLTILTLPQRDSDLNIQTNSFLWYKTADFGYLFWTNYNGAVPTWAWNNTASNWGSAFTSLTTNQFAKHLACRTLDGNFHVLMGQAVYTSKVDAVNGVLPDIPDSLSDTALMMAEVVVRGGATNFLTDSSIYDIRPLPPHLSTRYGGGIRTAGASISHSTLMDLNHDDHMQYSLANGGRAFTGIVGYDSPKVFSSGNDIPSKGYVDTALTNNMLTASNNFLRVSGGNKMTGNLNAGGQGITNSSQLVLIPNGTIYPSGNVNYLLLQGGDVSGNSGMWLYGTNAAAGYAGSILAQLGHTNGSFGLFDYNTNAMLVASRTGVGIGTNSPSARFEIESGGAQTHIVMSGKPTDYGVIRRKTVNGGVGIWGGDDWNTGASIWLHGTNFQAQSPNMGAMQFTLASQDLTDGPANQASYQFFDHTQSTLMYEMIARSHAFKWYDGNGIARMILTNITDSSSWLGVNTNLPVATLDVNGDAIIRNNLVVTGGVLNVYSNATITGNVLAGKNLTVSNFMFRTMNTNLLANGAVLTPVSDLHMVYGTGSVVNATNTITLANPTQSGQMLRVLVASASTNKIRIAALGSIGLASDWVGNTNDSIIFISSSASQWTVQGRQVASYDASIVLNNQNNTYTVGTTQTMSIVAATGVVINAGGYISLLGTNAYSFDTNLVLLADGTQASTAPQNGGGFAITNSGGLSGTGVIYMTTAAMTMGTNDTTHAKYYFVGEGSYYTNKPLMSLHRSAQATANILEWGVGGTDIGWVDVNGNLNAQTSTVTAASFIGSGTLVTNGALNDGSHLLSVWVAGTNTLSIVSPNGQYTNLLMSTHN